MNEVFYILFVLRCQNRVYLFYILIHMLSFYQQCLSDQYLDVKNV